MIHKHIACVRNDLFEQFRHSYEFARIGTDSKNRCLHFKNIFAIHVTYLKNCKQEIFRHNILFKK